jgi:hypothetical protein
VQSLKENDKKMTASAQFQADIRFVFQGFEVDINDCEGFPSSQRNLLVHNILKTMTFSEGNNESLVERENILKTVIDSVVKREHKEGSDSYRKISSIKNRRNTIRNLLDFGEKDNNKALYSALPYMLKKNYFDDAFVLHEETKSSKAFKDVIVHIMKNESNYSLKANELVPRLLEQLKNNKEDEKNDKSSRRILDQTWASLKNLFKNQPLWRVRDYFGEQIALYFAFCGFLIRTLWIPA